MGTLKIKGVNILDYTTPVNTSETGTASNISQKLKGVSAEVDTGSKKIVTGWELDNSSGYSDNSNYDAADGKIKINGAVAPIMIDGTRPRNLIVKATVTGTGLTYYLNNINGVLYLSTSANSATGTTVISSKAPNKDCVVNIACWGSGGKGGEGAFWFMAGNWGGVGGAGGAKAFFTICIRNNDYIKIVTESDSEKTGRITNSSDTTYPSPNLYLYNSSNTKLITCEGGYSGTSNNPRWSTDNYAGGGSLSFSSTTSLPIIWRKTANGANKISNGQTGNACVFVDKILPYSGNPEENNGALILTGAGGTGPDASHKTSHGSGGGGSYGTGGNAGDTGNGSSGASGTNGAGGGGGGSPSGGCKGGDGGLPGFTIFY